MRLVSLWTNGCCLGFLAWFEAGYLAPDLPVRHGDNGIYVNIASLGDRAFLDDEAQAFKDALNSIDRVLKLYKE